MPCKGIPVQTEIIQDQPQCLARKIFVRNGYSSRCYGVFIRLKFNGVVPRRFNLRKIKIVINGKTIGPPRRNRPGTKGSRGN